MTLILPLVLVFSALFLLYKYLTRNNSYFRDRNVPHRKPIPIFGNQLKLMFQLESAPDNLINVGNEFRNEPYVGLFDFSQPSLCIQDPEMIKQLGIKHFENFVNHRIFGESNADELFLNSLFMMKDQKWKDMRATLSPAFTGNKMRMMFHLVKHCAENMVSYCHEQCGDTEIMTVKPRELFTKVTTDIISTCAFGLEVDCLRDPNNDIFKNAKKILDFDHPLLMFKFLFIMMMPKVAKWMKMSVTPHETTNFFKDLVRDTIAYRRKTNTYRPDVIQLLIEAMDGKLKHDTEKNDEDAGLATIQESDIGKKDGRRDWTDGEIAAQCFLFFLAGYETTGTLLNFAAYQLAVDQEVQAKLYDEVRETENKLNGETVSYEELMKMQYLDAFICECLRMFPPMVAIDRVCNKDTTIEDGKGNSFTIPKGMTIFFNTFGVHYNHKYYPNPGKFDPNRFYGENKKNIQPHLFISFGIGPRACVGSRFALMQMKLILYYMIANFSFEISEKTIIPLRFAKSVRFEPEGCVVDLKKRIKLDLLS
ncbi:probable cytochrome P450 9f2 [Culicoides brevitarsis]|uniref:probable cytochrome P450 9f2 n=1 Tax=Culicoides brevitarsis TaxID=469753 RepID=UPI00307B3CC6